MNSLASGISTGIGGVVATESDLVANGCAECPLVEATIEIWSIEAPTTPEADVASITRTTRITSIEAAPSFQRTLAPGTYVVCAGRDCIEASVQSERATTVNVLQAFGPTTFWTDDASGQLVQKHGIDRPLTSF